MKAKFTLLTVLAIAFFSAQAQTIPNNGFDTWTSSLNPDGWATYGSAFGFNFGLCAKDSIDKVVGPNSVRVYSDSVPGQGWREGTRNRSGKNVHRRRTGDCEWRDDCDPFGSRRFTRTRAHPCSARGGGIASSSHPRRIAWTLRPRP